MGGIYEVDKNSGGTVVGTKTYYPAAGAMRVGSTLYYMLKDHLGSASVLTNSSGAIVTGADTRYYPFGEARFSTTPMLTDKLYTGQREITGLGIYHYGARFYSPKLGRFLSADTIVPGYANPQNLNRYTYVTNNPLRYTDPTGHRPCEEYQGVCLSEDQMTDIWNDNHNNDNDNENHDDNEDNGGSDLTTPTPTDSILTEPILTQAEGGANEYSCFTNPLSCGGGATPSSLTEHSSEEPCRDCALEVALGVLAVLEGAVVAGAAVQLMVTSFTLAGPVAIIGAPGFLLAAAVGVNWMLVGFQEINAGLNPGEHHEVDYLPLVPDTWQR